MPPKKKKIIKKEESDSDSENSFSSDKEENEINDNDEEEEEDKLNDGDIGLDDDELNKEEEDNDNDNDNDDDDCIYRINKNEEIEFDDEDDEDDDPDIEKINEENIYVNKEDRISRPYITKYERVRILSDRAKQLETGAQSTIRIENIKDLSVKDIAKLEFLHKKIPFYIERKMPNGKIEQWRLDEFLNINESTVQSGGEVKPSNNIKKSGILLVCKKDSDYFVPLFKHSKRNTYVSLGGNIDENDNNIKSSAIREANEETYNSLIIGEEVLDDNHSHTFTYQKGKNNNLQYKVYYVLINNYDKLEKLYNKNLKNFNKSDKYNSIEETKGIKLFNLKKFKDESDTNVSIGDDEIWKETFNSLVNLNIFLSNNELKKTKCTISKNNFVIE